MPWLAASSASSRGVQWLIGRPASDGGVQARAMIRQSCSGVNVGGAPERGASASTPRTTTWSARSSPAPPSSSAASNASPATAQRPRHAWTRLRLTPRSVAIWRLLLPWAAASTTLARITSACGLVLARTTCSSTRRCRAVTRIPCARGTAMLNPSSFPYRTIPLGARPLPPMRTSGLGPPSDRACRAATTAGGRTGSDALTALASLGDRRVPRRSSEMVAARARRHAA